MNDRAYVEELLGYLKMGIRDKKKPVETLFQNDISEDEYEELKREFQNTIDRIHVFNDYSPLKSTRYKQKNDFYTLFSFVHENLELGSEVNLYQYKILLILDGKDSLGRQLIRPTNDECEPLKKYATNCVSQSNSKTAREERQKFFVSVLKNVDIETNHEYREVLKYLGQIYENVKISLVDIDGFQLLDINNLFEHV